MNTGEKTPLLVIITVLSAIASFAFIYYGLTITMSEGLQQGGGIFAYVVAGYGLGNVYLLSSVWRNGGRWPVEASKLMGLCFLAVFILETINSGTKEPVALTGRLVIVLILWANWYTIKRIAAWRDSSQPR